MARKGAELMLIHRRSFSTGLGSLLAAPAIVHAQNIMSVHLILPDYDWESFNEHPEGMTYQWIDMPLQHDQEYTGLYVEGWLQGDWRPVPVAEWRKKFWIKDNSIHKDGCVLMQKPRELVKPSRAMPWPEVFHDPEVVKFGNPDGILEHAPREVEQLRIAVQDGTEQREENVRLIETIDFRRRSPGMFGSARIISADAPDDIERFKKP